MEDGGGGVKDDVDDIVAGVSPTRLAGSSPASAPCSNKMDMREQNAMNESNKVGLKVARSVKLTTRQAKTKARRTIPETDAIVLQGREEDGEEEGRQKEKEENDGKSAEKCRKAEKKEVVKLKEDIARPVVSDVHWSRGCTSYAA